MAFHLHWRPQSLRWLRRSVPILRCWVHMGAIYIILSPAILMGQPIAGALLGASRDGDYLYLKLFAGLMMFVGGSVFIFARAAYDGGEKRIWI